MYKLPALPYGYDELSPSISEDIMRLHYEKHHQSYVDKLNKAIEGSNIPEQSIEQLLKNLSLLPKEIQEVVQNQGGGYYNHSLFWNWMTPNGAGRPTGALLTDIESRYGSFEDFVDNFSKKAAGLFGSGWVWLMPDLTIQTTQNQLNPIMKGEPKPILGLDVWEHAYYLDYQNRRDEYIASWWSIVNWPEVEKDYAGGV